MLECPYCLCNASALLFLAGKPAACAACVARDPMLASRREDLLTLAAQDDAVRAARSILETARGR